MYYNLLQIHFTWFLCVLSLLYCSLAEDDDGDHIDGKCDLLDLIEASTEVEKLLEENKYFCEECQTYVEAERSIHYDVLPDILTLHLKRFSSETGYWQ